MSPNQAELEDTILKVLAGGRRYQLIGYHQNALIGALREESQTDEGNQCNTMYLVPSGLL